MSEQVSLLIVRGLLVLAAGALVFLGIDPRSDAGALLNLVSLIVGGLLGYLTKGRDTEPAPTPGPEGD